MSLRFVSLKTYRIYQGIILIIPSIFTLKCIQKFLLVRKEKGNPLKTLKLLFWSFSICANASPFLKNLVGVTSEVAAVSKFRIFASIFTAVPVFSLLCMLITTTKLTENIVLIAIHKGWKGVNWKNLISFLSIAVLTFAYRLSVTAFLFFTNVILKNKAYTIDRETYYFKIIAFYYQNTYHPLFREILACVGLLEGISFLLITHRLIYVLSVIYKLMRRSSTANKIKGRKLKEWGVFIVLCCLAVSITVITLVILLIEDWLCLDPAQKIIDNVPTEEERNWEGKYKEKLYFFKNYDIFNNLTRLIIGIASAFIAPCRGVMRDTRNQ